MEETISSHPEDATPEYVTDFKTRKSYRIFGKVNNPRYFGIDIEIDPYKPFPERWKIYNENANCDYIAYVTYTSHNYPDSHIVINWNIKPDIDILTHESEYIKISREIDNFQETNKEKILYCARRHFNEQYHKLHLEFVKESRITLLCIHRFTAEESPIQMLDQLLVVHICTYL